MLKEHKEKNTGRKGDMFSYFYDDKKKSVGNMENNENKETYTELIEEFKDVRNELNSMYASLKENEVTGLDLEKVIKFFNSFGKKFLKEEDIEYDTSTKGIVTVNLENNQENIILNNGKKIIITENSNLNMFNYDELVEILRLLDTIIVDKSKDSLRVKIVDQINNISTISFIKT